MMLSHFHPAIAEDKFIMEFLQTHLPRHNSHSPAKPLLTLPLTLVPHGCSVKGQARGAGQVPWSE